MLRGFIMSGHKFFVRIGLLLAGLMLFVSFGPASVVEANPLPTVAFNSSNLNLNGLVTLQSPTTLEFGPDGRLYVGQRNGLIRVLTVVRSGLNAYTVTEVETITAIRDIPNYNDDGTPNATVGRQMTGLIVRGTAGAPVIYATSSDPRGTQNSDTNLDTNSGVISRVSWNGASWVKLDLVRGLPKSEEYHAINGVQLDAANNRLFVAIGGNTNMGAPGASLAFLPETAYSAAILSVNLTAIGNTTYNMPTLDDPTRPNVNGITDPAAPGYNGIDVNDPFGGNDGFNQAKIVPGGPVQVYMSGFRNPYDLVLTQSGRLYAVDNGPNAGFGGFLVGEGPGGTCTNQANDTGSFTRWDNLHLVTQGGYAGHPNPIRGNPLGAGWITGSGTYVPPGSPLLPIDWPPVPAAQADARQCQFLSSAGSSVTPQDGSIANWNSSTNGIAEYRASNFANQMKGDLLLVSYSGALQRVTLNSSGTAATSSTSLASGFGALPLDVTAQGDFSIFPGTIWTANFAANTITVFEPNDYSGTPTGVCDATYSTTLDSDGDGFSNADEIDNGTSPCSGASTPPDNDGDKISDKNDPDDDNDGILDINDAFQIDPNNGLNTNLPLMMDFDPSGPAFGTGIADSGFTGLMINGSSDYLNLYDYSELTVGGIIKAFTIDNATAGDAVGAANNQEYAFQRGINVNSSTAPFTVRTRVNGPFFDGLTPSGNQAIGFYIGTGDQSNFLRFAIHANGGAGGLQIVREVNNVPNATMYNEAVLSASYIDLFLTIDPLTASVQPRWANESGVVNNLGAPIVLTGALRNALQQTNRALAIGIIATSNGGAPFTAQWDELAVNFNQPGVLSVTPGTYSFGAVLTGSDEYTTLILKNEGIGSDPAIEISSLGLEGASAFTISGGPVMFPVTLTPGQTETVGVRFAPTVDGSTTAIFRAIHNGQGGETTAALSGTGQSLAAAIYRVNAGGPQVAATDGGLPWERDQASPNHSPRLVSTATSSNVFTGTLVGPNTTSAPSAVFTTERWDPTGGPTLNYSFPVPEGSYEVRLYFAEIFGGAAVANGRRFNVAIEGTTVLTNFDQFSAALAETGNGRSAIMRSFPVTITGTGQSIDVVFSHGLNDNPVIKALEIIPKNVTGALVVSPGGLNFGTVTVGNVSAAQSLRLSNAAGTGGPNVTVNSLAVSGAGMAITTAPSLPVTLAPGQFLDVAVRFAPTSVGVINGALNVNHTGSNNPLSVALTGRGSSPPSLPTTLSADNNPLTFSNLQPGLEATRTLQLTNLVVAGNPSINITNVSIVGPDSNAFRHNLTPQTLASGASVNVTVTHQPMTLGPKNATMVITHSGDNSPLEVALEGNGVTGPRPSVKVNFQTPTLVPPTGYARDFGEAYGPRTGPHQGSGLTYGWVVPGTNTPRDLSVGGTTPGNGRRRFIDSDLRLDTLFFMQYVGSNGTQLPGSWEIALPNGTYLVTLAAGDPQVNSGTIGVSVEGVPMVSPPFTQTTTDRMRLVVQSITVNDGRLTVTATGTNTRIQYIEIEPMGAGQPFITGTNPVNNASDVSLNTGIAAFVSLPNVGMGVNAATLSSSTVILRETISGTPVLATYGTSGGLDVITVQPVDDLLPNTSYTLQITSGVQDMSGASFLPYTMTFTTGAIAGNTPLTGVVFEKLPSGAPQGNLYTSLTMGPDGRLYAASLMGTIYSWAINSDGTLADMRTINNLAGRAIIGIAFSPTSTASNMELWVTHNFPALNAAPHFSGSIAALTSSNGTTWNAITYIEGLPRAVRDHMTNSLVFGPDGAIYITQGSISAMGARDNAWGFEPETILSAAVLRIDPVRLKNYYAANGVLNVRTGVPEPSGDLLDASNAQLGDSRLSSTNTDLSTTRFYNPQLPNAPLTIYATGLRNAYDLVWHSNGQLYVPTNGSAGGGNTPATPSTLPVACQNRIDNGIFGPFTGPAVPASNPPNQPDYLFRVTQNGYYGHPNPVRCEWAFFGGNPTAGPDPGQTGNHYPVGVLPDRNYRGFAYDMGMNASANGVIEYRSSTFGGLLQGRLMVTRYSLFNDIVVLQPGGSGDIVSVSMGTPGFTDFIDPLDITEHVGPGNLYVSDLADGGKIILVRPLGADIPRVEVAPETLYFWDAIGGSPSEAQTITIRNTGTGILNLTDITVNGPFQIVGTAPTSLPPFSSATLQIAYQATASDTQPGSVLISSNAQNVTAPARVNLRGAGITGTGGSTEPSLQRILATYSIPVDVGDDAINTAVIHSDTALQRAALLGEEISAQTFRRFEDGNVDLEILAVFGPNSSGTIPVASVGWYLAGNRTSTTQLFQINNGSHRSFTPSINGVLSFDPGTNEFGLYSNWPFFGTRNIHTEDALNTHTNSIPHHVRVYQLKDSSGAIVPHAYVVATEEHIAGFDYNDLVMIIRNVIPGQTDVTPPLVDVVVSGSQQTPGNYINEATVTVNATDLSGISLVEYSLDGAAFQTYTGPVVVTDVGAHTFIARATDNAGLVSSSSTSSFNVVAIAASGTVRFENRDWVTLMGLAGVPPELSYLNTWLTFSNLNSAIVQRQSHNIVTLRIHNDGATPLQVLDLVLSDPARWSLPDIAAGTLPITIAPASFYDLRVQFIENGPVKGVFSGTLQVLTTDPTNPSQIVQLRGSYQALTGGSNENAYIDLIRAFGITTTIPSAMGSEYRAQGDEVLPFTWRRAAGQPVVYARQIAAYHGCPEAVTFSIGGSGGGTMTHSTQNCHTVMPKTTNGGTIPTEMVITPAAASNFAISAAGYSTTACQANPTTCTRHGMRLWPIYNPDGLLVPNLYLAIQDYVGSGCGAGSANCDYQDNMYLVYGIQPSNATPNLTIDKVGAATESQINSDFAYTIRVRNASIFPAAATVTDILPAGLSYVSSSTTLGTCSFAGSTLTCNLGTMVGEQEATITLTVRGTTVGYIDNRATVTSGSFTVSDTERTLFFDAANPPGRITITKNAQPDAIQTFSFTGSLGSFTLVDDGVHNGVAYTSSINFGPNSTPPSGFSIADTGLGYTSTRGYGWVTETTRNQVIPTPQSIAGTGRDRLQAGISPEQNTLLIMNYPTGTPPAVAWRYDLPNGRYRVTVSVGDATSGNSNTVYTVNANGTNVINGYIPTGSAGAVTRFKVASALVDVTNGRLILDALGGQNVKINYVRIEAQETITPTRVFPSLVAGNYTINEVVPIGWRLDNATCSGGTFVNTANGVTVNLASGQNVTCTFNNSRITGPSLDVEVTPPSQRVPSGYDAPFTVRIVNNGTVILNNVTVSSPAVPDCARVLPNPMQPGDVVSFTCSASAVTAPLTNDLTVSANGGAATASASATVALANPALSISKTPDTQIINSGQSANFTITVTNTGDVDLADVTVSDPLVPNCNNTLGTLVVGQTEIYSCTLTNVSDSFTNTATVTGRLDAVTISESDTALVAVNGVTYGTALYRVNAGGPLVAATDGGPDWSRDQVGVGNRSPYLAHLLPAYSGSQDRATDNGTGTIPNTTGVPLGVFRYERWDPTGAPTGTPASMPDMRYSFPVAEGLYEVRLYFADRNGPTQRVGGRVFDVLIENNLVLDDFDIYVAAVAQYGTPGGTGLNGGNGAIMRRFIVPITGTGQSIDVDFRRLVENPSIRGLEVVPLTITPPSVLGATPTTVNFGNSQITLASAPLTVDLSHLGGAGAADINITDISLSGPNADQFSIAPSGAVSLTAIAAQTLDDAISVIFSPTTLGLKQAQISITHTGSNTPLVVALRGTGIPLVLPDLIATPADLTFDIIEGTTPTPVTVTLSASEGSPVYTIDPTSLPAWLTVTPLSDTIPLGGSVTLTLTPDISSLALGTYTANLLITSPLYDPLTLPITLNVNSLLHPIQTIAGTGTTISLTSGTIDVATGIALVANNSTPTFTFSVGPGYAIDDVLLDGVSLGAVTSTTLPAVTGPQTLEVRTRTAATYTITASASFGGTVTPAGAVTVNEGNTPQFTFTPDTGYMVNELLVNGVAAPITGLSYTFAPVTSDQTLDVTFDLLIPSRINVVADNDINSADIFAFTLRDTLAFNQAFSLTDNGGTNNRAFDNLQRGLYTLTGVIPAGRTLELTCTGGTTTVDLATGSVTIDLAPGDDVTCTYRAITPPNCAPYSDQACATVPVIAAPQMCLGFDAPVGGLSGTGFTMVDRPSNNRYPATPSVALLPGYEPSLISLSGGNLVISATQGLLHQTFGSNVRNNSQVNALGVGFDATTPFFLRVELVNPTMLATNNSEQAGLWFGLDEDNYVKLVVTNAAGDGNAVVELRREIGGATDGATANVRLANVTNANTSTFNLELAFNPVSNQVTGRFTSSSGQSGTLGPLIIPASFFAGRLLPDGATGPVSFGGVFSSTRFNATPITFAFDNFCVERDTNNLPVGTADSIRVARGASTSTLVGGATSVLANDSDADNDPLTAVLATGPANGTLTLNADGTFVYTHNNSATTSDSFTYRVSDGKGQSALVTVTIEVFTACAPYSDQTCDTIPVIIAPQMCLSFDAPSGGLSGTGFTMVDRPSNNRYPITPSIPAMPGYEPSRISLSGGQLVISATQGLFHQIYDGTSATVRNNSQVNALGVGVAMTQPFTIRTQLINPAMPDASQSEQGGLWFGLSEDNYIRLALVNRTGLNNGLIELRREINGVTGTASATSTDARTANVSSTHNTTFNLELAFAPKDATTWTVTGRYTQVGGPAASGTLGPLDVPISFISGQLLPDGATGPVSFGGVYTSTRFSTAPMSFTFDNFCVTISNNSPVAVNDAITVDEGGTVSVLVGGATSVLANDTDAENDPLTVALVTGPVNGTLTLNPDGTFSYTHNGSETTSDSFTYRVNDGISNSNLATVTITINPVNDAPVAVDDAITVDKGGTVSGLVGGATSVLANDTDAEGATLRAILVTPPAHGTLTLNDDGTFSYVHDGDETTSGSFTYRASDGTLESNLATVTITINPVNDAPIASPDAISLAQGGTATTLISGATSVLANDSDPDNAVLTAVLVTGPVNGTLTLNANGTFSYTHNGSDTTSDSFTYKANDGQADSNTVTVTITIALNNKAPIAVNDAITVAEGGTATVLVGGATSILANDSDPEGSAISLVMGLVTQPAHGMLTLNADGTFIYTHDGDETSSDSFTYVISDGELNSLPATVTITITPVNDAPVAVADAIVVNQGSTATALVGGASSVLANDTDPDNAVLNAVLVTGPTHGTLTLNANGTFSYTHDGSNNFSDSFTYKANDGQADSNTVTVTITINPVNRPPVGVADAYTVRRGAILTVTAADGVLANDSDPDLNDPISVALIADLPAHGSLSWNADGSFTYVHNGSDTSSDSFSYVLQDSDPTTLNVTVRVNITITANNPPQAVDDAFSVANGQTMTSPSSVLANDTDAENDPLTAVLVTGPTNGTLTFNADGTFVYEHNGSSTTTDSFTYRANDGFSNSSIATVTITITGQATRPTASNDSATALTSQTTMIDVLANDTYRGTPTVTIVTPPAQGTASVSGTQISYAAPATFTSSLVTFTYTVTDVSGLTSEPATVSIILRVNGPSLIVIITPPPGPIIVPQSSPNPPSGQGASPQAPTTFVAPISLRIVNNGSVDLMGLTMTSINTATPPLDNTACQMSTPFDLLVGEEMTFTCTDDVSALSASYDRIFTFTDSSGQVVAQVQTTILIQPNFRPQAVDDVATVGVGQTIRINVLANDTDPEDDIDPTTLSVFTPPSVGSAAVSSSNRIAFTAPAVVGEVTFVYSICDAFNQCALATVRVNVVEAAQPIDDADDEGGEEPQDGTNDAGQQPLIDIFDPSISKIGLLLPGQLGVNGERLEWVITVRNPGTVTGTNVVVTDTLRSELRIDSVRTSKGTSSVSGQTVTFTIPEILPGETVLMSIFTTVLQGGVEISNTATINADNLPAAKSVTSAGVVGVLPQTGESPWGAVRDGLASLALILVGGAALAVTRRRMARSSARR